jgi:hypothetical protein
MRRFWIKRSDRFSSSFSKELETLYEILSPSPELRDYIEDYNRLADLFVMLRNAYGKKTDFYGDISHKTEMLVRENAAAHGFGRSHCCRNAGLAAAASAAIPGQLHLVLAACVLEPSLLLVGLVGEPSNSQTEKQTIATKVNTI